MDCLCLTFMRSVEMEGRTNATKTALDAPPHQRRRTATDRQFELGYNEEKNEIKAERLRRAGLRMTRTAMTVVADFADAHILGPGRAIKKPHLPLTDKISLPFLRSLFPQPLSLFRCCWVFAFPPALLDVPNQLVSCAPPGFDCGFLSASRFPAPLPPPTPTL